MKPYLVILALFLGAGPGKAFVSKNNLLVEPTGRQSFHVPYRGESGIAAFWCAAGDYVVRELGRSNATLIYRTSSLPRRSGQGVDFSLSPERAKPSGLVILGSGKGVTAGHARGICNAWHLRD